MDQRTSRRHGHDGSVVGDYDIRPAVAQQASQRSAIPVETIQHDATTGDTLGCVGVQHTSTCRKWTALAMLQSSCIANPSKRLVNENRGSTRRDAAPIIKRRRPESNWCRRLCRPLPSLSATSPTKSDDTRSRR